MTDSKRVQEVKATIKKSVGEEKYLAFMNDLAKSTLSVNEFTRKHGISANKAARWADALGYRSFRTRQQLRNHKRRIDRIEQRRKNVEKFIKILSLN